ncbi:hypothetical protein [Mesorhizobium sp. B2-3-10]|uniref:hypothetical protein n=1 Tax=Mesorhizobium sp. B2-3-10 TaxID=2589954 RepID=UPI0015E3BBF1|nr:hypothetical protein [Mesorhizobium sp. B2-3-10]
MLGHRKQADVDAWPKQAGLPMDKKAIRVPLGSRRVRQNDRAQAIILMSRISNACG